MKAVNQRIKRYETKTRIQEHVNTVNKQMNILEKANEIVFQRKEEKERMYGSFSEGMVRASRIASASTGKDITPEDMYMCMIALKLSRQSFNHKEDNLLDAIAYLAALNNHINKTDI